jgi:hypothetical protein
MHAALLIVAPTVRSRRVLVIWALGAVAPSGVHGAPAERRIPRSVRRSRASYAAQLAVSVTGGAGLSPGGARSVRQRTAEADSSSSGCSESSPSDRLQLDVNVRSLLPMSPAVAVLIADRLRGWEGPRRKLATAAVLVPSAALSLWVAWADLKLADSAREAASALASRFGGERVWFQGHWGFQYYAEASGLLAVDVERNLRAQAITSSFL